MCGIAGIIQFNKEQAGEGLIRSMTNAMPHRGPDADKFYVESRAALGHRRLSIIDLSTAADQPFTDASGRYVMVFNGEMYNFQEVRAKLPDYPFHTSGDTEVLIAAYAKWGADCIRHFRGMFAFAIWDRLENELFMARDRMGVKPLYYYMDEEKVLFASETRAILATGLVERKVNEAAVLEYFNYQSVGYPYSIIRGIEQLEAGTWMKVRNGVAERKMYWDVTTVSKDTGHSEGEVKKHIRELMLRSVERRLISDVPVGAFLSGGIDSSAVVGLMAEAGKDRPNTFNIAFEEKEFDESYYAGIVAKKFNTHHHRILLKPTMMLDELRNALDAMDTPSGDGINTYVVSKEIRRNGITVALSGIGGDELFAGYPFFSQYVQTRGRQWLWNMPAGLRKLVGGAMLAGQPAGRKARILQLLQASTPGISDVYPVFRRILSPELIAGLTRLSSSGVHGTSLERELAGRKGCIEKLPLLSQVSVAEYLGYTQQTLLKDTDQMSMASSLEVREPFFDQDLVEYVLGVPDAIKTPTYAKSLLVESLKPLLPDEVVFRKKQGFLFPWHIWLKNELRAFCDLHIRNIAQRSFVNGPVLMDYWERFLAGDERIRWPEIWLFVVLEYWLEKNQVA